jgi:hypothetical protein
VALYSPVPARLRAAGGAAAPTPRLSLRSLEIREPRAGQALRAKVQGRRASHAGEAFELKRLEAADDRRAGGEVAKFQEGFAGPVRAQRASGKGRFPAVAGLFPKPPPSHFLDPSTDP